MIDLEDDGPLFTAQSRLEIKIPIIFFCNCNYLFIYFLSIDVGNCGFGDLCGYCSDFYCAFLSTMCLLQTLR